MLYNMSNLVRHAEIELNLIAQEPDEDNLIKPFIPAIKEIVKIFAQQGHSGGSAPYGIRAITDTLRHLLKFEPLLPIKGEKSEWLTIDPDSVVYQNKRLSSLFKNGDDGKPYYLDAIIWKDQNGLTTTGRVLMPDGSKIYSAQMVKFPFIPKSFYIDVICKEIAPDNYEWHILDANQLDKVFDYYIKGE